MGNHHKTEEWSANVGELFSDTSKDRKVLFDFGHWGRAERITLIICGTIVLIVLIGFIGGLTS